MTRKRTQTHKRYALIKLLNQSKSNRRIIRRKYGDQANKRTNSIKFRSMNSSYCYYQAASQSIEHDDDDDNLMMKVHQCKCMCV